MVPLKHLKEKGLTNNRLKRIFTCKDTDDPDHKIRKRLEERIRNRVRAGIDTGAKNASLHLAVDLAWDGSPITKENIPLLLFAQDKINLQQCAKRLHKEGCLDDFAELDKEKNVKSINMPRLYEVSVNLVRSLLLRRIAAQQARYSNLWPYFKYESRGASMVDKARAAILSSRVDVMADQYGYRHFFVQAIRDMFLYAHTVIFPTCAWDTCKEMRPKPVREAFDEDEDEVELETVTVREGLDFVNPHPTRVYWDMSQPLARINTDTGPSYIGFWDIVRYGDIKNDDGYFNRDCLQYSSWFPEMIGKHPDMFAYYFPPEAIRSVANPNDASIFAQRNDRKLKVGMFAAQDEDKALVLAHHYEKINPKQEGIAEYPYDVWVRFDAGVDDTVVFAEWLPSAPAAYGGINENDNREANLAMAHDLLGFQDQLSNILSQLMRDMKSSMMQLWLVNKDALDKEAQDYIRDAIQGDKMYEDPRAMFFSATELDAVGLKIDQVVKVIESTASRKVNEAFTAITELLGLAERMLVLSPQELGQNSQRETSASEVVEIAKSVDTIYTSISDGVDEMRAAVKKMIYESLVACSTSKLRVPDRKMFNKETVEKAGFRIDEGVVEGDVTRFVHEYVFNSRDGAERTSNVEAAKTLLTSLNNLYPIEEFREWLGKERLSYIFQEIFRLSGNPQGGQVFELTQEESEQPVVGSDKANKLLSVVEQLNARVSQLEQGRGAGAGLDGGGPPSPDEIIAQEVQQEMDARPQA